MHYTIISIILSFIFLNLGAVQLDQGSQIIVNKTIPKKLEDIIINQDEGGDISREIIYPTIKKNLKPEPVITAVSALVIDAKSGLVLFDKNSKEKRSIASITKLMTALVFLDQQAIQGDKLNWDKTIDFTKADVRAGRNYFGEGEQMTVENLFSFMLVGSINSATATLVRSTGLSEADFVSQMNKKAQELKMRDSYFVDPTGLDAGNTSTARDLAKLVYTAMQKPEITKTVAMTSYQFSPINKKVVHQVDNTDKLLGDSWLIDNNYSFVGGKTGFTEEAGYNFASQINNAKNNSVIGVVLGDDTLEHRFSDTKEVVKWVFESFEF